MNEILIVGIIVSDTVIGATGAVQRIYRKAESKFWRSENELHLVQKFSSCGIKQQRHCQHLFCIWN